MDRPAYFLIISSRKKLYFYDVFFNHKKRFKKRVHGKFREFLPWDSTRCARSLHYTLLLISYNLSWKIDMADDYFTNQKRLSLMTFWNSKKSLNFKAHELCTRMLRVPSLCSAIAHIYSWTLWKKAKTKNTSENRKWKSPIIISNYNLKYSVISNFTLF